MRARLLNLQESFAIRDVVQRSHFPGRLWIVTARPEYLKMALKKCNIVRRAHRIWPNEASPGDIVDWDPESLPKAGQWVRARRGLYKGDLALVLGDCQHTDVLQIAVVPRIHSIPLPQSTRKLSEATPAEKKRKSPSGSSRPAPSIFDPLAAHLQSNARTHKKGNSARMQNIIQKLDRPVYTYSPNLNPTQHILPDGMPRSSHEGEVPENFCFRYNEVTYIGGLLIKTVAGSG